MGGGGAEGLPPSQESGTGRLVRSVKDFLSSGSQWADTKSGEISFFFYFAKKNKSDVSSPDNCLRLQKHKTKRGSPKGQRLQRMLGVQQGRGGLNIDVHASALVHLLRCNTSFRMRRCSCVIVELLLFCWGGKHKQSV